MPGSDPSILSSALLSICVGEQPSVIYQYDMKRALAHLVRKNLASMQDLKGISGMNHPCSDAKKAAALSKLSIASRAEKAMEAEQKKQQI